MQMQGLICERDTPNDLDFFLHESSAVMQRSYLDDWKGCMAFAWLLQLQHSRWLTVLKLHMWYLQLAESLTS